ncbi:MAG: 30S ribosomal protein S17 [Candidatus Omnitrophica bacterium CG1_02_46_14]|nr:MAG: 30S ribosomal protein S17 [Candidatus Omnitrophica bacterium CG1_02_46_14]
MTTPKTRENFRKKRTGIVLSDKMKKTIVVRIKRKALHPLYGKVMETSTKFKVHDEKNEAKVGDKVKIQETRPLSKDKRWRLIEILSHGHGKAADDLKEAPGLVTKDEAKGN